MTWNTLARTAILASVFAFGAATASAQVSAPQTPEPLAHECDWNYKTRVQIDGRQIDWEEEVGTTFRVDQLIAGEFRLDWTGPNDASFLLWCRQDDANLYFAIVGRDNFIHAPKGRDGGDRMELWFEITAPGAREDMVMMEIPIWPALEGGRATVTYGHGRSGEVPGASAALSERHDGKGFFMEVQVPIATLGGNIGFEPIRFTAVQRDLDHDGGAEYEVGVGSSGVRAGDPSSLGHLRFGRFFERMKTVLESQGLDQDYRTRMQIWADLVGDGRREWVGVLENQLVVTAVGHDGFDLASVTITDHDTHEPLEIRAVNIDRDDDHEILYRYRIQRTSSDGRHVVLQEFAMVIDLSPAGMEIVAHQETANEIRGVGRIESRLELRDRGDYTIVRFRRATGNVNRSQFVDIDAGIARDYDELLLPWDSNSKIDVYDYGGGWTRTVD